ncbi:hypothetical protein PG996_003260 [Apiospora saccharicola]|uniref:Uncharacterized protein n=1 Tax=Apiospora saccharicola TaxID=335842 RepID=A0ABR1W3N7_9PEZI
MSDLTFSVGSLTTRFSPTVTSCCSVYIQCESGFDRASYISVSQCYTRSGTPLLPCGRFVTTSYTSGDHIFAYGVNVRRASGDPVWSGEPDNSPALSTMASSGSMRLSPKPPTRTRGSDSSYAGLPSSPASFSPGEDGVLSSGAKIGIGVGVVLGALLILGSISAAYLIGKRSRRKRDKDDEARRQAKIQDQAYVPDASHQEIGQKWTTTKHVAELPTSGYEGSTAYCGSEGTAVANFYTQLFGSSNNRPWVCEIGPSERSPVEMGSSEPASELASRWQTSRKLDTSPRLPTH